jgi:hypothetical protein
VIIRKAIKRAPRASGSRWSGIQRSAMLFALLMATICTPTVARGMKQSAPDRTEPQCWDCIRRLTMELPAVNPQEDPTYERGLTPGSVLPALSECSLDDGEIPRLEQIIKIFTDALVDDGGVVYVRDHLNQMSQLSSDDRARLVDGARQSLDSTLRHLIDHNCRILLKSHFEEGASRGWLLTMIDLGQSSSTTG